MKRHDGIDPCSFEKILVYKTDTGLKKVVDVVSQLGDEDALSKASIFNDLLLQTVKGIGPVKQFDINPTFVKVLELNMKLGIGPENVLTEKSTLTMDSILFFCDTILPLNLFCDNSSVFSSGSDHRSLSKVPDNKLLLTSNTSRLLLAVPMSVGNDPVSF